MLSDSLEVDFVLETIEKLIKKHGIELTAETLIHSDQGCHYTSTSFIQILNDKYLRQSMSRRGNCGDNAPLPGIIKEKMFPTTKSKKFP